MSEIVIIRRRNGHGHDAPHGGVWKVAFADFMTAMMAFFLVLWIVNSTSKETRSSVARYFNPIKLSDTTPARRGLQDPRDTDFDASADTTGRKEQRESPSLNGPRQQNASNASLHAPATPENTNLEAMTPTQVEPRDPKRNTTSVSPSNLIDILQLPIGLQEGRRKIAESNDTPNSFFDPFEARRQEPQDKAPSLKQAPGHSAALTRQSGNSEITDPSKIEAGALIGDQPKTHITNDDRERRARSIERLEDAKKSLERAIAAFNLGSDSRSGSPRISIVERQDGLLISLIEKAGSPMFTTGSAQVSGGLAQAIGAVARILGDIDNPIVVSGYTDSTPFRGDELGNWRLSALRALAAMENLISHGIPLRRIEKIEGHADRLSTDKKAPIDATNRRVDLLVRF